LVSVHCATPSVHPHGRGDNLVKMPQGPSPLRFTPTGVGTTSPAARRPAVKPVHPHGRGDNAVAAHPVAKRVRFTPTGVGTTK